MQPVGAVLIRVGVGVTGGLGQWLGCIGLEVSKVHRPLYGDAVTPVVVHQPVEGTEGLLPYAVLAPAFQNSEVFHHVTVAARGQGSHGSNLVQTGRFTANVNHISKGQYPLELNRLDVKHTSNSIPQTVIGC